MPSSSPSPFAADFHTFLPDHEGKCLICEDAEQAGAHRRGGAAGAAAGDSGGAAAASGRGRRGSLLRFQRPALALHNNYHRHGGHGGHGGYGGYGGYGGCGCVGERFDYSR